MSKPFNNSPSSNTNAVITLTVGSADSDEGSQVRLRVEGVQWSYDSAPTGGNLKIESPSGTTIFSADITDAGPGFFDFSGSNIEGAQGQNVIITLAAGGSGVTGKINAQLRD